MLVRTGHETTNWFQIEKGVCQGCILSPCLFNLYAEYITRNTELEETQAGIKIAGRNINNLRYTDDPTLVAENEDHGIRSHHFMASRWGKWTEADVIVWAPKSLQKVTAARKIKDAYSLEGKF